jgi:hypothetical protein
VRVEANITAWKRKKDAKYAKKRLMVAH